MYFACHALRDTESLHGNGDKDWRLPRAVCDGVDDTLEMSRGECVS